MRHVDHLPKIFRASLTFLGVFAKLPKATFSFDMSVTQSDSQSGSKSSRMEQPGFRWTDFHEI